MVRNRKDSEIVSDLTATENHQPKQTSPEDPPAYSGSESEDRRLSLEARNEKAIEQEPDQVTKSAHLGVQKAEAAALVWSKKAVYITYAWVWVCFFLLALQMAIGTYAQAKAYADFQTAPAISTASILASIIGGVMKLPVAKILNIWGRCEGLLIFTAIYILGIVILASCNGPSSYAAGYVIYYVGYDALYISLDIFVADTSGMRNRAFAIAFVSTPFICTAFTASLAADSFIYHTGGWRWAYGAFTIIMTAVLVPMALVFKFYQKKAEKLGLYKHEPSGRTFMQSTVHYIQEFDIVGAVLLMAGWILLLLPFSLQTAGRAQYKSASFIAEIVVGVVVLGIFAVWEKFFARAHFVSYELLKKRTVLGACFCSALINFSFYCWDLYFLYFCYVVYDLDTAMAGYMTQIYNVGSCFWGVVFGIWIRYVKSFKWSCFCFGLPLLMLGAGLMIHFRGDGETNQLPYTVMCQIFIAFGGGTLVIGNQMAVMASSDRENVPLMLALIGLFASLGGAIGNAVSAAIYSNTFVDALTSALPDDLKGNATQISNGGWALQQTYPLGSPSRNAANYAWGYSQKCGAIAATAILVLAFPCIAIWKNYKVDKRQNKGVML
ncbi:hypothetical protein ASPWEDRAFT_108520 [Aspergillus wentii DTO 134E9]|uniref:Major facilitator superfamily (MFS) profile domain-containing protein n=1 Tax=Aspergillus wentii DTO 134E9 TaxID=1073089 RepID=A0A1L9RPP7_ASPWE|nr:uncharacterized protein ASPWEDRAFT_108520 [Aspergillus wentii DTO 134E9]OJJ36911.1 hypothetical protein ASPWEDRAFT_108520 [Aspergillus wentii DTO 134E9]